MHVKSCSILLLLVGTLGVFGGGCAARQSAPHVQMGEYRKLLERQKAGMRVEEEALKTLPAMTAAEHERVGDHYLQQGNLHMAFVHYDKALRLDPTQPRLLYKTGRLFLQKGVPDEAIKEFQEILKKERNYALAYEGLGQGFFQRGDLAEAEQHFHQALKLNNTLWQSPTF